MLRLSSKVVRLPDMNVHQGQGVRALVVEVIG